ncbi:MAG: hypothetical protein ACTSPI_07500, partial [Candidatus Heimdallarchaeaceae archaeon]
MKRGSFKKLTIVLLVFLSLVSNYTLISATTIVQNSKLRLTITITYAYYTDANDDGFEDDIIMDFIINITKLDKEIRFAEFDLIISLTLPSGFKFDYNYNICTYKMLLNCTMFFYNHATESGDYIGQVTGILYDDNESVITGVETYIFDPPGESGDVNPPT